MVYLVFKFVLCYKKSREKAVSIAARSLITLFREVRYFLADSVSVLASTVLLHSAKPTFVLNSDLSFIVSQERSGHPIDPKARSKAFGETIVAWFAGRWCDPRPVVDRPRSRVGDDGGSSWIDCRITTPIDGH